MHGNYFQIQELQSFIHVQLKDIGLVIKVAAFILCFVYYRATINQLQSLLNDPKFPGNEETKGSVKRGIRRILDSVDDAKSTFQQEQNRMAVTNKYWKKVQEARMHFSVSNIIQANR